MSLDARYAHTNLVARDWQSLATFYEELFGCVRVPPERDYAGPLLEAGTGIPGARLRGVHLRLPGYGDTGPTLEIFSYEPSEAPLLAAVNRPAYGHIAFAVADVAQARDAVLRAGGRAVGEVVALTTGGGGVSPGATSPTPRATSSSFRPGQRPRKEAPDDVASRDAAHPVGRLRPHPGAGP